MRTVIQKVSSASVSIEGKKVADISKGLLVLLGIEHEDDRSDADWLCEKIVKMRIFTDEEGKMNRSVQDEEGSIIVVSQFTLHASTKKGNRPSFIKAARPEKAIPLYEYFIEKLKSLGIKNVGSGRFGAMMDVELVNEGPVTVVVDSKNRE